MQPQIQATANLSIPGTSTREPATKPIMSMYVPDISAGIFDCLCSAEYPRTMPMPNGQNGMLKVLMALSVTSYILNTRSMNDQLMPGRRLDSNDDPEISRNM